MRVLAFSGGKDAMACLHLMLGTLDCAIYVDTGRSYPETAAMVKYAKQFIEVHTVHTDRAAQNEREGLPAEVLPVDWTRIGQLMTSPKPVMVQSYTMCHWENVAYPFLCKAKELGATEIVYGQRNNESHRATSRDGDMVEGMKRLHPIENWSSEQVLNYLATIMDVPAHYQLNQSSLDCFDCTAFRAQSKDRIEYTKEKHPEMFDEYMRRLTLLNQSLVSATENW